MAGRMALVAMAGANGGGECRVASVDAMARPGMAKRRREPEQYPRRSKERGRTATGSRVEGRWGNGRQRMSGNNVRVTFTTTNQHKQLPCSEEQRQTNVIR